MKFETIEPNVELSPISLEFARDLDSKSISFRDEFVIPKVHQVSNGCNESDQEIIYLCGNSLGLQPKGVRQLLNEELDVWGQRGVNGHFDHPHGRAWVTIDDHVNAASAKLVGAQPNEVAIMNSLTPNLHLMMVSFYQPTKTRFKILMEAKSFPSDYFAIESQVSYHGFDPDTAIIQVKPKPGSYIIETKDILDIIEKEGNSIAVVLFSGVQYYTGQFFEMNKITAAGHKKGCFVGWDLAHAVGNVKLELHEWGVDFACWCSYKYLNSGPGGIGGAFIHSKHNNSAYPRFAGWWGSDPTVKFGMELDFKPIPGAQGYRLSNPSVLCVIALLASLNIFEKTSMSALATKSKDLTGYLEKLIQELISADTVQIITPKDPNQRGCQLSLLFLKKGLMNQVFKILSTQGVICDERKPDVLRISPAPLYNTFTDVWHFVQHLKRAVE